VSVVVRAADLLRVLAESARGLSLAELATGTGLPRSSVHRILQELEAQRFVLFAGRDGGYRLGPGLLKLALISRAQLVDAMRPVMVELAREVRENIDLAVLSGVDVVIIDQVASAHRLQAVTAVGGTFPAHSCSLGKALLAELTDDQVRAVLEGPLSVFTPHSLDTSAAVIAELPSVRRNGVAFDHEEHDLGISSVATVIHSPLGVAQAISIVAPTHRFSENAPRYVTALKQLRRRLEQTGDPF
jgi:IclR family acetate operon transcriptional repressor